MCEGRKTVLFYNKLPFCKRNEKSNLIVIQNFSTFTSNHLKAANQEKILELILIECSARLIYVIVPVLTALQGFFSF